MNTKDPFEACLNFLREARQADSLLPDNSSKELRTRLNKEIKGNTQLSELEQLMLNNSLLARTPQIMLEEIEEDCQQSNARKLKKQ